MLHRAEAIVLVVTTLAVVELGCVPESPTTRDERVAFQAIAIGMSADEVVKRLGKPRYTYDRHSAPSPYYVTGYAHKERAISHSVLIYVGIEWILYVYLNADFRVEDVFVGGS